MVVSAAAGSNISFSAGYLSLNNVDSTYTYADASNKILNPVMTSNSSSSPESGYYIASASSEYSAGTSVLR